MATLFLVLGALLALSVLVLVHEFGHFIIAKKGGVWVEEFGIGYPPRVFGKKIGETIYSLNLLPLGGFVRLHGETTNDGVTKPDRAFLNKSKTVRLAVSLAGIAANMVLAIIAFTVIAWIFGPLPLGIRILEVSPDSPASSAQILPGDRIVSVSGSNIFYTEFFQPLVEEKKGKEIVFKIERTEDYKLVQKDLKITPRINPPEGQGALGVVFSPVGVYEPQGLVKPFIYLKYGVHKTWFLSERIVYGIGGIFSQASRGQVPEGVGGPVTVTAVLAEFVRFGLIPLIEFSAVISINLALVNLIPFPPLDGSRALLIIVEAITRKKLPQKVEVYMQTAGMAILLGLVVLLTATEIPKLISAGSLSGFVESILGG